jgi:hypothetical protein
MNKCLLGVDVQSASPSLGETGHSFYGPRHEN